jgi:hypothetical protein
LPPPCPMGIQTTERDAMAAAPTISDNYLAQQKEMHRNPNYGVASLGYAPIVKQVIEHYKVKSVSDYGAGKQNLLKGLGDLGVSGFDYFPYDPAFPDYGEPKPADLVCCIDVLEHIEPSYLDAVLGELRAITVKRGFLSVHSDPAVKHLPDGRNAHLIQERSSWWLPRLCNHFEIRHLESVPGGFWVLAEPRRAAVPPG